MFQRHPCGLYTTHQQIIYTLMPALAKISLASSTVVSTFFLFLRPNRTPNTKPPTTNAAYTTNVPNVMCFLSLKNPDRFVGININKWDIKTTKIGGATGNRTRIYSLRTNRPTVERWPRKISLNRRKTLSHFGKWETLDAEFTVISEALFTTYSCWAFLTWPLPWPDFGQELFPFGFFMQYIFIAVTASKLWWSLGESNPLPQHCQCRALPNELRPHIYLTQP